LRGRKPPLYTIHVERGAAYIERLPLKPRKYMQKHGFENFLMLKTGFGTIMSLILYHGAIDTPVLSYPVTSTLFVHAL
jgi:hypothetical protein